MTLPDLNELMTQYNTAKSLLGILNYVFRLPSLFATCEACGAWLVGSLIWNNVCFQEGDFYHNQTAENRRKELASNMMAM
jgi:hypothetical protein